MCFFRLLMEAIEPMRQPVFFRKVILTFFGGINRYTSLEISRLLRGKSLSFVQISDMLNFSSPAYFSRYVSHNLGVNSAEYRG